MIGEIRYEYGETTSTNDEARKALHNGAPSGSVFITEHQTAGRGRRGASWQAALGESVLMTVVLYPSISLTDVWKIGWVACIAVIDTLSAFGIDAKCKWPNDVLVGGKKISGILIETVTMTDGKFAALVGIGINVLQRYFPEENEYRIMPTSILMQSAQIIPTIKDVINELCQALDRNYSSDNSRWDSTVSIYNTRLILGLEQAGTDPETGARVSGKLVGVRSNDGAARLLTEDCVHKYVIPDLAPER